MNKQECKEKYLDLNQAAEGLGISPMSLRRKVQYGEISHYRPSENGKIYFTNDHLREFKERRTFTVK